MVGWATAGVLIALIGAADTRAVTLDDVVPGSVYAVGAIRVQGNAAVSTRAIRNVMLTRAPLWYRPWQRKPTFNPGLFRTDLARIRMLLRESGYYRAEVGHDLEVRGDTLTIVIRVDEGPAARVADVAIAAADFTPAPDEEAAERAQLVLEPGRVFTQEAYDQSRDRLERFHLERGFAYATVEKAAVVDSAEHLVRLTYIVRRGPPAVFGATTVSGLVNVAERLVRREIAYRPGDPYDPKLIERTRAAVFGLRLFRSVVVAPSNLAAQSGAVDVVITVSEGPPRELTAGVGYGLEDELRGQLRWQHNDFFGGGRQLGFRLKGSAITQAFEGEFHQPYFLHPQQSLVVPLTQAREDEPGFNLSRVRLAPRVARKLTLNVTASVGYTIEYDDLSNVSQATIERLDGYRPRGFVSSLTGVIERNTTVDLLDPHEGSVLNLSVEQAGGPWQGDYSFFLGAVEAKKYVPIFAERTLAGRVRVGAGDGFGQSRDLPLFRRFFAGGITSTRGYDRHLVGPLDAFDSPIGGRSLLDASLELRTPVYKQIGAVVFFDVGEVRRRPFSYTLDDLQYGTGVGVRYHTIVGPLRLDVGFPLEPPPGQPSWKVHFAIGQAF
jgi:outer membrane protein insertion porin family/translocation and assembly module TamA